MCKGLDQLLSDCLIMPSSSMYSNSALAICCRSGASRRGRAEAGGPRVWIWLVVVCLTSECLYTGRVMSGYSRRREWKCSEVSCFTYTGLMMPVFVPNPCTVRVVVVSISRRFFFLCRLIVHSYQGNQLPR